MSSLVASMVYWIAVRIAAQRKRFMAFARSALRAWRSFSLSRPCACVQHSNKPLPRRESQLPLMSWLPPLQLVDFRVNSVEPQNQPRVIVEGVHCESRSGLVGSRGIAAARWPQDLYIDPALPAIPPVHDSISRRLAFHFRSLQLLLLQGLGDQLRADCDVVVHLAVDDLCRHL